MAIRIRKATEYDIEHLIRIRVLAHGGFEEAAYGGLDLAVEDIIRSELADSKSTEYYENYWVTEDDGDVTGGMSAFPYDDHNPNTDHPMFPAERQYLDEPFESIEAPGTYYIHALTVFPAFTRRGIASTLLALAGKQATLRGLSALSLYVFAQNRGAVSLYKNHGFVETGRSPLPSHAALIYSGDLLLMTSTVPSPPG